MAATGQEMAYRCEQCGSPEIVALSQLYEQGTRSFSGRFTSGVSQSYTAGQLLRRAHADISARILGGDSNYSSLLMGACRIECAAFSPQERRLSFWHCRFLFYWPYAYLEIAL